MGMVRAVVACSVAAVLAAGCASSREVEENESAKPAARAEHHWVHYSESDVYRCDVHDHWFHRVDGRWVEAGELPFAPLGQAMELESKGADPWLDAIPETGPPPAREASMPAAREASMPAAREVSMPAAREVSMPAAERHEWVLFPRPEIYYCHVHDHYLYRQGDGWAESYGSVDADLRGSSHEVEDDGPQPYLHLESHLAREAN